MGPAPTPHGISALVKRTKGLECSVSCDDTARRWGCRPEVGLPQAPTPPAVILAVRGPPHPPPAAGLYYYSPSKLRQRPPGHTQETASVHRVPRGEERRQGAAKEEQASDRRQGEGHRWERRSPTKSAGRERGVPPGSSTQSRTWPRTAVTDGMSFCSGTRDPGAGGAAQLRTQVRSTPSHPPTPRRKTATAGRAVPSTPEGPCGDSPGPVAMKRAAWV